MCVLLGSRRRLGRGVGGVLVSWGGRLSASGADQSEGAEQCDRREAPGGYAPHRQVGRRCPSTLGCAGTRHRPQAGERTWLLCWGVSRWERPRAGISSGWDGGADGRGQSSCARTASGGLGARLVSQVQKGGAHPTRPLSAPRSEERRVGKEHISTGRYWWARRI